MKNLVKYAGRGSAWIAALWIASQVSGATPGSLAYTYDSLYRLTRVTFPDGTQIAYTYDALGNRLQEAVTVTDTDADGMPDSWEAANGLLPADAGDALIDTDRDGRSNLLEYALGLKANDGSDAQEGMVVSEVEIAGERYLTLKFKRRRNSTLLQYLPEVSSDRQTWHADNAHLETTAVDPLDIDFEWVTVRDLTPITAAAPRFIRLKVVKS